MAFESFNIRHKVHIQLQFQPLLADGILFYTAQHLNARSGKWGRGNNQALSSAVTAHVSASHCDIHEKPNGNRVRTKQVCTDLELLGCREGLWASRNVWHPSPNCPYSSNPLLGIAADWDHTAPSPLLASWPAGRKLPHVIPANAGKLRMGRRAAGIARSPSPRCLQVGWDHSANHHVFGVGM